MKLKWLHNDVLGRIHTILKQDDYFRTLKELPAIDGLHAYDDIQLFPELFDMPAVIERITSEADLIEKQLNRSGMYPLPQTPLPLTSGFIPRPSSTFWPIMPAAPPPATEKAKPHQTPQSQESSPGSLIPCGQGTPTATSSQHQDNQMIAPPARLLRLQCPTLQKKRYQNHSMERESRIAESKLQCPQLLPKTVDSASDVNSQVT